MGRLTNVVLRKGMLEFGALATCFLLRLLCWFFDLVAAGSFSSCEEHCSFPDPPANTCHGMLLSIATFNGFVIACLLLILWVRWFDEDRAHRESRCVAYSLVHASLLLKVVDFALPIGTAAHCRTDLVLTSGTHQTNATQCGYPTCLLGNFWSLYFLYATFKSVSGLVDLATTTRVSYQKVGDWYGRGTRRTRV
uniref:Uncharacterized protein n=1 Tax=Coccolithus braarudii TaxID=221442 RepID=A0A7S0L910_9EUKA|mmetsp:Transcript_27252/g.58700  ORF Transcript_27252/g.58700 Transcript_27252/m.58700 type:complete len:194 (+) Transcript_27252:3-584(+)